MGKIGKLLDKAMGRKRNFDFNLRIFDLQVNIIPFRMAEPALVFGQNAISGRKSWHFYFGPIHARSFKHYRRGVALGYSFQGGFHGSKLGFLSQKPVEYIKEWGRYLMGHGEKPALRKASNAYVSTYCMAYALSLLGLADKPKMDYQRDDSDSDRSKPAFKKLHLSFSIWKLDFDLTPFVWLGLDAYQTKVCFGRNTLYRVLLGPLQIEYNCREQPEDLISADYYFLTVYRPQKGSKDSYRKPFWAKDDGC